MAWPKIADRCLDAGQLDEIQVNLIPVLLGAVIRYFSDQRDVPLPKKG